MKRILVICDDKWHPAEVVRRGLTPLRERGYELDIVMDAKDMLDMDYLRTFDTVIVAKGDGLVCGSDAPWFEDGVTRVMPADFRKYVEEGGGYLSLHAGNCFTRNARADMTDLTGNSFLTHPKQCKISLEITDSTHPIAKGVSNTEVFDEHYMFEGELPQDARLFMQSRSVEGGVQSAGYTRLIGHGRLCVLTAGHNFSTYRNPEYLRAILNAVQWLCGEI